MATTTRCPDTVDQLPGRVSRMVVVPAAPSVLFALLTDPGEHARLDGSDMIKGVIDGPARLKLGSVFRMQMKGYKTTNTVIEYERDVLIAWRHRGRHIWRWQLRAVPGGTEVTETFDYRAKRARRLVQLIGVPTRAGAALENTLTALQVRFA
jgi:hypothetical protein